MESVNSRIICETCLKQHYKNEAFSVNNKEVYLCPECWRIARVIELFKTDNNLQGEKSDVEVLAKELNNIIKYEYKDSIIKFHWTEQMAERLLERFPSIRQELEKVGL